MAKGSTRRVLSPVLVVGATSFAIVAGVGMARYALADQQSQAGTITTKATSTTSAAPAVDVHAETSASSQSIPSTGNDNHESTATPDNTAGSSRASVTVNGETYTVQENGQLHTTTTDNNGQTSIDISVQSSGSGQQNSSSSASSHVHVFSNSFHTSQSNRSTTP